ncbi:hypothetical protein [Lactobacillus delbrueckii]|uniref:hypothetical protein n=1 Tax=Lactobacillus delbrueckii TaxID=1584 RepID=UPI0022EBAB62|nr:hypothetical protein [Lactobacillus delbrueckii]MDA3849455.1 hypothetical protein [Lactobacillus delbrueckii]
MTVALEGHLLTALMYMAFLVPAWLYAIIKRENKRGILLNTLKAVLLNHLLDGQHPLASVLDVQDQ